MLRLQQDVSVALSLVVITARYRTLLQHLQTNLNIVWSANMDFLERKNRQRYEKQHGKDDKALYDSKVPKMTSWRFNSANFPICTCCSVFYETFFQWMFRFRFQYETQRKCNGLLSAQGGCTLAESNGRIHLIPSLTFHARPHHTPDGWISRVSRCGTWFLCSWLQLFRFLGSNSFEKNHCFTYNDLSENKGFGLK